MQSTRKNSSKSRNTNRSTKTGSKSADNSAKAPRSIQRIPIVNDVMPKAALAPSLSVEEKARLYDNLMEHYAKAEQRAQETDAERQRKEREGVTLRGLRLDQARRVLDEINISAVSIHQLAISAVCSDGKESDAYLIGIENAAVLLCRRADVVSRLLGGGAFGNFIDELEPLTEERAAELEREEAEAAE